MSNLIKQSELRDAYEDLKEALDRIRDRVRYSVQDDGERITLSRKRKGDRLLELNLEFNVKQGLDPQIRIGDSLRFRYDYVDDRPMLEYSFRF